MFIEWVCFGSMSGYGISAIDYILALHSLGINVRPFLLDSKFDSFISGEKLDLLNKLRKIRGHSSIQVYHMIPDMHRRLLRKRKSSKIASWAIYEAINPPYLWINLLKKTDLVLTPSRFCFQQFSNKGLNLHRIPHCIDSKFWTNKNNLNTKFTFLFIGTWKKRKGYDILLESWKNISVDAQLWIKTDQPIRAKKETNHLNNVYIYDKQRDIIDFMSKCHVIVAPSLGEAFGLVPMQALALEIPVIVTKFGGFLEYANSNNAIFINPKRFQKISCLDNIPQFRNKIWPVLSSKELTQKMEWTYNNYPLAKKMAKKGCKEIKNMLQYNTIGKQLINTLKKI